MLNSDKKVAKCRGKENKHVHAFQTCLLLGRVTSSRCLIVFQDFFLNIVGSGDFTKAFHGKY